MNRLTGAEEGMCSSDEEPDLKVGSEYRALSVQIHLLSWRP